MIDFKIGEQNYKVVKPNAKQHAEANKIYTTEFNKLLKEGVLMVKDEMLAIAKKRGLWSDKKEVENKTKAKEIVKLQDKIEKGGYELSEAREDVKRIQELRSEMFQDQVVLNGILDNTVEQQATNARYDYLASVCIVDEKNRPVCKSLDDYYNSEDPAIALGTFHFSKLFYGTHDNKSVDIQFVEQYGLNDVGEDPGHKEEEKVEKKPFLQDGKPIEDD